jgi:hypothetical protein
MQGDPPILKTKLSIDNTIGIREITIPNPNVFVEDLAGLWLRSFGEILSHDQILDVLEGQEAFIQTCEFNHELLFLPKMIFNENVVSQPEFKEDLTSQQVKIVGEKVIEFKSEVIKTLQILLGLISSWSDLTVKPILCTYWKIWNSFPSSDVVSIESLRQVLDKNLKLQEKVSDATLFGEIPSHVTLSFRGKYWDPHGTVKSLYDHIAGNLVSWKTDYHSPTFTIVNGSMVGKSRTCVELYNHAFILYLCFRNPKETGYPWTSHIATLLEFQWKSPSLTNSKVFMSFLWVITGSILKLTSFLNAHGPKSFLELSQDWKELQFKVANNRRTIGMEFWDDVFHLGKDHWSTFVVAPDTEGFQREIENNINAVVGVLKSTLQATVLVDSESSTPNWSRLGLIFIIDECRSLLQSVGGTLSESYFVYFRLAFSCLPDLEASLPISGLFIDTLPIVANLVMTDPFLPIVTKQKLFPAYCAIDVWDAGALEREPIQFNTDFSPKELLVYLKDFGRPAWAKMAEENVNLAVLLRLGQSKLIGRDISTLSYYLSLTHQEYLAIMNCRLALNITPSSALSSELVAYHSSVCSSISDDERLVYQRYCSDPMLMISAVLLCQNKNFSWSKAIQVLQQKLEEGIVFGDYPGELIPRLLFVKGMDEALLKKFPSHTPYGIVTLQEWLESTFHFDAVKKILMNQDKNQKTLDQLLQAKVFFNAFYVFHKVPTVKDLTQFFERGLAMICKAAQTGVALIIPLKLANTVSFVLIQCKNTQGFDAEYEYASRTLTPQYCGMISKDSSFDQPYLSIWISLGYKRGRICDLKYMQGGEKYWPTPTVPDFSMFELDQEANEDEHQIRQTQTGILETETFMEAEVARGEFRRRTKQKMSLDAPNAIINAESKTKAPFPEAPFVMGVFGLSEETYPILPQLDGIHQLLKSTFQIPRSDQDSYISHTCIPDTLF